MSDLNTTFEAAVANSKNLSERPDNATLHDAPGLELGNLGRAQVHACQHGIGVLAQRGCG